MSQSHRSDFIPKKKDTQSRKWLITIMQPFDKGYTRESIREILSRIKPIIYYCMCEEVGRKELSHHIHIFICCSSGVRFSSLKRQFPEAHLDLCRGSVMENRDYIRKEGKYENSRKKETNLKDTFEEYGEVPPERFGENNAMADLFDMIKDGFSNYDIIEACPQYMFRINDIEKTRQVIKENQYKSTFRNIEVTYVEGVTNSNKTRDIMDRYGYENVCRVTSYNHSGSFENYSNCQDVLLLDEYRSSLKISELLVMLEGYPYSLPCRYNNRIACYTKVYIVSNLKLFEQYPELQKSSKASWNAFLRRIINVKVYKSKHEVYTFDSIKSYMDFNDKTSFLPIDNLSKEEQISIPWPIDEKEEGD